MVKLREAMISMCGESTMMCKSRGVAVFVTLAVSWILQLTPIAKY